MFHDPNLTICPSISLLMAQLMLLPHSPGFAISNFKAIENLDKNHALKKLYLYENQIKTIENIDHLTGLEVLWLNGNEITKIEVQIIFQ